MCCNIGGEGGREHPHIISLGVRMCKAKEACESGSMLPDLKDDGKILAVTASNGKARSICGLPVQEVHGDKKAA